jgi:hypothetical protein
LGKPQQSAVVRSAIPERPEGTVSTRQVTSTLADLPLETDYRSDFHDLVRDFYLPCLAHSTRYRRAIGHFTCRGREGCAA